MPYNEGDDKIKFWLFGKLGFVGAPAGAEGRFFKEKAPQKPFWERFFDDQWRWCEHGGSHFWERAQYLPKAKTVSGCVSLGVPIYR